MNNRLVRYLCFVVGLFFLLCLNQGEAWAGQWRYIGSAKPGHMYLADSAPKLLKVLPTGKIYFRSKDKKYCQKFFILYQRAGRDQGDRTYPVIKARRWEDVIDWIDKNKLYKNFPLYELFHFWNKHMPDTTTWKRRFPTLKAIITYKIACETGTPGLANMRVNHYPPVKRTVYEKQWVWHSKWWITGEYKKVPVKKWISPPASRKALGKTQIKEEIVYALPPGRHQLEIRSKVDIDPNHPLVKFKQIYNWKKYAKHPIEIIADKIAGYISIKSIFKKAATSHAQNTVSVYQLDIPAIMPNLRGMHKTKAYYKLQSWSLKPRFKIFYTGNKRLNDQVKSQKPAAGTLLKAGAAVDFIYYVHNPKSKNQVRKTGNQQKPPKVNREEIRAKVKALKDKCYKDCQKIWQACRDKNCAPPGYSGCSSDCGGCPGDPCGWVLNTDWFTIDPSYGACAKGIVSFAQGKGKSCSNKFLADKKPGRIIRYRSCMQKAFKAWVARWDKNCREPACKKKCIQAGKKFKALVQGSCICQ
ncbi:PASTA domain-containing protein [Dethiosulfatarculus sandiegensis]|nr:PASTA domain-containing protein [Dethiosulfatarculus sandiegensis]